jgi:predicted nucleic acid-binding protein
MSVFVDTGVFYAHHDTDASRHDAAMEALDRVLRSPEYGQVMTSDYVYDEVITLTQRRTNSVADALTVGQRIRGDGYPDAIELLHSTSDRFEEAVAIHQTYSDQALSFTDSITVSMVNEYDIDDVLSFDDDFDGVVSRLSPETLTTS